jgi:hypothetical protein
MTPETGWNETKDDASSDNVELAAVERPVALDIPLGGKV